MRLISALLASAFALGATAGEAQLLPAGEFKARDGRPGPGKAWRVTDEQGTRLAAQISQVAAKTPIVIDYDHQTIRAETNGQPAPAAGWILSAQWRPGQGLYAKVDWTAAARQRIDAKEYLYISPVIVSDDDTGEVQGVLLAALLNHPALLGMDAVVAQLGTQFSHPANRQESDMTILASLIALLGLPAATSEADTLGAITALKAKADAPPKAVLPQALATALNLQAGAGEPEALSAITALKAAPESNAAQAMHALNTRVAELTAQVQGDQLTKLVDAAISGNKLVPAQRDWAMTWGKKDFAALQGFVEGLPVIPGLNGQSLNENRDPGRQGVTALSDTQKLIATQLGLDPAKYLEQLKAAA